MKLFYNSHKLKPVEDGGEGGGAPSTESSAEAKAEDSTTKNDYNLDEFGYEKLEEGKDESTEESTEVKAEEKDKDEVKVENPSTGYGEEDENEASTEVKAEEKDKDEEQTEDEKTFTEAVKESLGKLPEEESTSISKFAKDNKLTADQVNAYAKLRESEINEASENEIASIRKYRQESVAYLKADKEFGGDNYQSNINKVEKILESHFPLMKKKLTERGSMMPPYLMKEMLGVYNLLHSTTKLVGGDPGQVQEKEEKSVYDIMYG